MFSPYSPFFTSGFLSQPAPPRRGSLPTDTLSSSTDHHSSAFYFTLQPQWDQSESRSFLSLDLAESQSLRSASLKRKASNHSNALSLFVPIPEAPRHLRPPTLLRTHISRDSLRTVPSPKPAPSTTLPDLPKLSSPPSSTSSPPRLPSFAFNSSLGLSLEPDSPPVLPPVVSRTPAPDTVYKFPKRLSTMSKMTTSSVSTRVRKINRSDALARLEGRLNPSHPLSPAKQKRNFMSMSDDEDDGDADSLDHHEHDPEDVVPSAPLPSPPQPKSAPVGGKFLPLTSFRPSSSVFKQQQDWFSLKSFIDLRSDEDVSTWSWRSWIEVASVS